VTDTPDTPDRPETPDTSQAPAAPERPEVVGGGRPAGQRQGEGASAPSGLGDLGGLLESAQQAFSAQAEAAQQLVEGSAGGGVVTVTMTGSGAVTSVTIAPEVVDPDEIEMLQDLIVAALHDAGLKVTELQRQALGSLGGLGLGDLGAMLGGAEAPGGHGESGPGSPGRGDG
jgi:nucleoid-associated protein EbfC